MPIFVTVMLALCNACWDLVLSRAAMLIKHVLCLVLPTDTTVIIRAYNKIPVRAGMLEMRDESLFIIIIRFS